jgi:hypothetical protein
MRRENSRLMRLIMLLRLVILVLLLRNIINKHRGRWHIPSNLWIFRLSKSKIIRYQLARQRVWITIQRHWVLISRVNISKRTG